MGKSIKSAVVIIFAAAMMFIFSGCLSGSADELYCLPQASERFIQLQQVINKVRSEGAVYSPPASGYNRQSVQLQDLDGDGQDEAIAFFKVSEEKPLRIYIFREMGGEFMPSSIIEGDGTAIDSINYVDMNNDGISELIIGWQMSPTVKMLTIYSIRDFQPVSLATADFSEYTVTDLDKNGDYEVFLLRLSQADYSEIAESYNLMDDGEMVVASSRLSTGVESIYRIMRGKLADGTAAVFVDSAYDLSGVITDVFVLKGDELKNITMNPESGVSSGTARNYKGVYCSDINNDGVMEVPHPRELLSQSDTSYYLFDWCVYDSDGVKRVRLTTYHNYTDFWYLVIPQDWNNKITIRREDSVAGERMVIFSCIVDEGSEISGNPVMEDFLKIYSLSGDNKRDLAALDGRFKLAQEAETIYAAEILVDPAGYALNINEQIVRANFNIVYSDWITGAI